MWGNNLYLLDGALGTELERRGASLNTRLWSAQLLAGSEDDKELIRQVHLDYLRAGSDVLTTASYQISYAGFQQELGLSENEVAACSRRAVDLASSARDQFCIEQTQVAEGPGASTFTITPKGRQRPLIAYSCGPFGASLGDGSEYNGSYCEHMQESELAQYYKQLIQPVLDDLRVDLLCFETIPCLKEAMAIARLLEDLKPSKPAWVSFSCKDGRHTCAGEPFAEEVIPSLWPFTHLAAVGINCVRPPYVPELLGAAHAKLQELQQAQQHREQQQGGRKGGITSQEETLQELGLVQQGTETNHLDPRHGLRGQELQGEQPDRGSQRGQQEQSELGQSWSSSSCRDAAPLHLVCYPNSGEGWDAEKKDWIQVPELSSPDHFAGLLHEWVKAAGGSLMLLGGCCRTTPAHIQAMRKALLRGRSSGS